MCEFDYDKIEIENMRLKLIELSNFKAAYEEAIRNTKIVYEGAFVAEDVLDYLQMEVGALIEEGERAINGKKA